MLAAPQEPRVVKCATCGEAAKRRCSKCHCTEYCNRDCQKTDWKVHKKVCAQLKNNHMLGPNGQRHQQAQVAAAVSNGGQVPQPTPEEAAAAQAARNRAMDNMLKNNEAVVVSIPPRVTKYDVDMQIIAPRVEYEQIKWLAHTQPTCTNKPGIVISGAEKTLKDFYKRERRGDNKFTPDEIQNCGQDALLCAMLGAHGFRIHDHVDADMRQRLVAKFA